jgi:hypothetical protein
MAKPTKTRRYHSRAMNEAKRKIVEFISAGDIEAEDKSLLWDALLEFAQRVFEVTPATSGELAGQLYLLTCDAWQDARANVWGNNTSDPRDSAIIDRHGAFLRALVEATGTASERSRYRKFYALGEKHKDVDETSDRIQELKRRLESFKDYGDITDSTAIFKLEAEISRLEREATGDEWAELIE